MATPPVFSAGSVLTAGQMNAVGMWKITSETFSAVTTKQISNCFTTDYDVYRVIGRISSSVNNANIYMRYRTSAGDDSGAYYWRRGFWWTTAATSLNADAADAYFISYSSSTASAIMSFSMDVYYPFDSAYRTNQNHQAYDNNNPMGIWIQGSYVNPVSHTGITFYPSSGTITGKIEIYGYRD